MLGRTSGASLFGHLSAAVATGDGQKQPSGDRWAPQHTEGQGWMLPEAPACLNAPGLLFLTCFSLTS